MTGTIDWTPGRDRKASLRGADLAQLATEAKRVWSFDANATERLCLGFGWDDVLRREGYDPSQAKRCWYDDGGLVVWCSARLDERPLGVVIPLLRRKADAAP